MHIYYAYRLTGDWSSIHRSDTLLKRSKSWAQPIEFGAGVIAGSFMVLLFFGRVHGITMAFGASLIGVSIDYVVHVYCFHALEAGTREGNASFATIGRSLATGAATTITGFLALAPSSLSGLREVACFAVSGMFASYLATRYMLPSLMPRTFAPVAARAWVVATLARGFDALRTQRRRLWVFPAFTTVFVASVLPQARWNEDFASLGRLDPDIFAEDARAQTAVPERFGHYLRQQVRWNKSFIRESVWVLGTFPFRHGAFWLTLAEVVGWLIIGGLTLVGLAAIPFIASPERLAVFAAVTALVAYARNAAYLDHARPGLQMRDRVAVFLLAPFYGLLHLVFLVPIRFWALATLRRTQWGTRRDIEVRLAAAP